MNIPLKIRRRVPELEAEIDNVFVRAPSLGNSMHKEGFIVSMCRNIATFVVFNYYPEYSDQGSIHNKVEELVPLMKYMYRTKLTLIWEKQNGK